MSDDRGAVLHKMVAATLSYCVVVMFTLVVLPIDKIGQMIFLGSLIVIAMIGIAISMWYRHEINKRPQMVTPNE